MRTGGTSTDGIRGSGGEGSALADDSDEGHDYYPPRRHSPIPAPRPDDAEGGLTAGPGWHEDPTVRLDRHFKYRYHFYQYDNSEDTRLFNAEYYADKQLVRRCAQKTPAYMRDEGKDEEEIRKATNLVFNYYFPNEQVYDEHIAVPLRSISHLEHVCDASLFTTRDRLLACLQAINDQLRHTSYGFDPYRIPWIRASLEEVREKIEEALQGWEGRLSTHAEQVKKDLDDRVEKKVSEKRQWGQVGPSLDDYLAYTDQVVRILRRQGKDPSVPVQDQARHHRIFQQMTTSERSRYECYEKEWWDQQVDHNRLSKEEGQLSEQVQEAYREVSTWRSEAFRFNKEANVLQRGLSWVPLVKYLVDPNITWNWWVSVHQKRMGQLENTQQELESCKKAMAEAKGRSQQSVEAVEERWRQAEKRRQKKERDRYKDNSSEDLRAQGLSTQQLDAVVRNLRAMSWVMGVTGGTLHLLRRH